MSKREIFGIKIFFTGIILFVITLSILNSCSLFHGSKMSKNKLKKEHHLADGSFKNIYASSINKPFSDLIKWSWNRTQPEPFNFKLDKNNPKFLKENREIPTLTWIGHATLLLQHKGVNILTDPHLTRYSNESLDVPEFLEVLAVHVVPSEEVRMVSDSNPCFLMVPELPTATKVLFP